MAAGAHDIIMEQGSTFNRTFTLKDDDEVVIDISGYRADMQIRNDKEAVTTILVCSTAGSYLTIPVGTDGVIELSVPASVTSTLDFDIGVYDLETSTSAGVVVRLLEGNCTLSKEVTRQ